MTQVITRFAPSPTGLLHAGNYRTAVFSYLFAKKNKGSFVVRVEDTDKERSRKEYEENILETLEWLGLKHDSLTRQSDRVANHKKYLQMMIDSGHAYISKEQVVKEGQRDSVIRFKNPNKKVSFEDMIRGTIEFDTTDLGDFVIAKSVDEPIFHLAVVVDDFESGITHIIRGEDHISNTPRQILIQQAIGAPTPHYAHLPIVLAADRTKLSKRKGALALTEYRKRGYLPEAILNYLAFLGWNPGDEREIMSEAELVEAFTLEKVQKSGAIFDEVKLAWVNKEWMKRMPESEWKKEITNRLSNMITQASTFNNRKDRVLPLIFERINGFGEVPTLEEAGDIGYFFSAPTPSVELLTPPEKLRKGKEVTNDIMKVHFAKVIDLLETISDLEFTKEKIKEVVFPYADQEGRGLVLWPYRAALSGKEKSPDPFELSGILGKQETVLRLKNAIELL